MNEQEALKAIQRGAFVSLNGAIMRLLNMIVKSESSINSVYTMFKEQYSASDIQKSVSFLHDCGYIAVDASKAVDSCVEAIQRGTFNVIKVKITQKGTRLLEGFVDDECVEV